MRQKTPGVYLLLVQRWHADADPGLWRDQPGSLADIALLSPLHSSRWRPCTALQGSLLVSSRGNEGACQHLINNAKEPCSQPPLK